MAKPGQSMRPRDPDRSVPAAISTSRLVNLLHRHALEVLTAVYLLYIVLGTLIPFDFSLGTACRADRVLLGLGNTPSGLPDLLSNLGLYVPLGVLLYISLTRTIGLARTSFVAATAIAGALSLAIESIQLLSPTRVSSFIDFGANLVGAGGGALLACCSRWTHRRLMVSLTHELRHNRTGTVLKICAALLLAGGLAPFTPTFDVERVVGSVQSSTLTPFAETEALAARARAARLEGRHETAAGFERDRMSLWARWAVESVSFGAFGFILVWALRRTYGFGWLGSTGLALYCSAMLAGLIGGLQLGILSRGFHLTDLLMRLAGTLAGVSLAAVVYRRPAGGQSWPVERQWTLISRSALAFAVLLVVFTGLAPFEWTTDADYAGAKLGSKNVWPFYAYHLGRFDRVCADFWGKTLRFAFLGAACWACWGAGQHRRLELRALAIAGSVSLVSAGLEIGQSVTLARVPSATDVLIAGFSAWFATVAAQYAWDFYHHATGSRPGTGRSSIERSAAWTPTDALVATLIPDEQVSSR